MNEERLRQIEELYHAARENRAVLDQANPELRREVESLLAQDRLAGAMEQPPLQVAAKMLADSTVSQLAPGVQLGPYCIEAPLGAGGMGEVYRAVDTRLNRKVAIKISAREFSNRFEREARAISALNHPHICTLYDVGPNYLVMELLEGETLAARLKKGKLSIGETWRYGSQIADALAAAHAKKITHRDLKPGNIMLTKAGVKVLDFGLAKSRHDDTLTEMGAVMGTPAYMAPEQREGKECDARTDIYALGLMIREMATGSREGTTSSLPQQLAHVIERCLADDPEDRWQAASDVRKELEWAAKTQHQPVTTAPGVGRRWILAAALACILAATAAALGVWLLRPAAPRPVTRLVMSLPPGQRLALDRSAIAISPDGTRLVYAALQGGVSHLYLRAMDGLEARAISGTEDARIPFFSPDGQWIGFTAAGKLKKVSLSGGPPVNLADALVYPRLGFSWGTQGVIAFSQQGAPIQQVSSAGGNVRAITRLEKAEFFHYGPEFLPDGKSLLFSVAADNADPYKVAVQSLQTGQRREFSLIDDRLHYASSGHMVYSQGENLMAAPFDLRRLALTGAAVPVMDRIRPLQYSFSSTGSLVYVPGSAEATQLRFVWVDRKGTEQPVPAPARHYAIPRLSPDGQRVAAGIEGDDSQIWIYDLARDTLTRLTFAGTTNIDPVWTPDGKRIVFKGTDGRLFWQPANGSGAAEALTNAPLAPNNIPSSWSPDGQAFVFVEQAPVMSLWTLSLKDREPQPFGHSQSRETAPRFSSDGRWIAYDSNESGRDEIYVRPYPGPGGKWQISTEGGMEPVWNPKGRELFYRNGEKMMAVEITTQPSFSAGKPRVLFEGAFVPTPRSFTNYDVSPDGQRFLMLEAGEQGQAPEQINVVLNWFEELKRRVPSGTK